MIQLDKFKRLAVDVMDAESQDECQETIRWALREIESLQCAGSGRAIDAVAAILKCYDDVALGKTRGSGGVYLANGKGTLSAVVVNIHMLEDLARAFAHEVHPRATS